MRQLIIKQTIACPQNLKSTLEFLVKKLPLPFFFVTVSVVFISSNVRTWLVAWLSGNALVSINEVTLRQARLVLGWVTVCERVNHLGM